MAEWRYCPSCGGEFRAGMVECPDCGEALIDAPPSPSEPTGSTDPEGERDLFDEAVQARRTVLQGSTLLRWVAIVAAAAWIAALVVSLWSTWDTFREPGLGNQGPDVSNYLAGVVLGSSGLLLVAVVAFAAHLLLEHLRAESLTGLLDERTEAVEPVADGADGRG